MKFFFKVNTGYLFIATKKLFFKIPFTFNAYRNLSIERTNIKKIKSDVIFREYLPNEFFFFIKISKKYKDLNIKKINLFLSKYEHLFEFKKKNKRVRVIHTNFFKKTNNLLKNEKKISKQLKKIYTNSFINLSSCHGDFYHKNILENEGKILFIDWNQYQTNGSFYYDFINYIIFSKKKYFGSWYNSWLKNYKFLIKKYPKIYVDTYIIWKISTEVNSQLLNNRLKTKMINILRNIVTL